jgi:hypothetical protein
MEDWLHFVVTFGKFIFRDVDTPGLQLSGGGGGFKRAGPKMSGEPNDRLSPRLLLSGPFLGPFLLTGSLRALRT